VTEGIDRNPKGSQAYDRAYDGPNASGCCQVNDYRNHNQAHGGQ
jgi:hypothetical protein